jgi:hypothetical protein
MAHITTCTSCLNCYEESSEEYANDPNRVCVGCYRKKNIFGPFTNGARVVRKVAGIVPNLVGVINGESEFGGLSVQFPYTHTPIHMNYWELDPA